LKVAIAGGKLQGVEASFLAQCLGWEVVLIDRNPNAPARGLCDSFYQCDFIRDYSTLHKIIKEVDIVVPALENVLALKSLERCTSSVGVPFAYDEKAHFISRSKKRSKHFFRKIGIPTPEAWPRCGLPVIVKPSCLSGSKGVTKISTEEKLFDFLKDLNKTTGRWVIEEYLEGPSYSLEVFGLEDHFEVVQITELEMDDLYDCRRVMAPAKIPESLESQFKEVTITIAKGLHLKGIMDVEVICQNGVIKVLEIDARLPSQTPITVLKSIGINMLEILSDSFVNNSLRTVPNLKSPKGVIYEQVRVSEVGIEVLGEHIMADAGPLKRVDQFFGADIALTNFDGLRFPWVATLITVDEDRDKAWRKRCQVIKEIEQGLSTPVSSRPVNNL